jgi:DNA-binding transcriptional LysR family regulator
MKIKNFADLEMFIRVAESGSLTLAAKHLDQTPALASSRIKRLEAELDTILFIRSTRSLRLSNDGELLLPVARQAIKQLTQVIEEMKTEKQIIRDYLQISMPSDLGRNQLINCLDRFQITYPEVSFGFHVTDHVIDMYRQPIDIAIRYGNPQSSGLIAVNLSHENYRLLCASPRYVKDFGKISNPNELMEHNCLRFRLSDEIYENWRFVNKKGESLSVSVTGNRISDDGDIVKKWATEGRGVAFKSVIDILPELISGKLVPICSDWQGENVPISLVFADRRQFSPTVQLLRDYLRDYFMIQSNQLKQIRIQLGM